MNNIISIIVLSTILFSCKKDKAQEPELELLFSSGFEGVVLEPLTEGYQNISGTDSETGFSWPISIWGASEETGLHLIFDDNQQALQNKLETVIGHNGDSTTALYNVEFYEAEDATQNTYEILDLVNSRQDLYVKYWMKLDSASLTQKDKWRVLFEYKTEGYRFGTGYRLIAFIYTDEDGKPYWHFQGDRNPQHPIWQIENYNIPVPMNEWFMVEYYWKWSNHKDGLSGWKVNGQLIGENQGATTRLNRKIDFIILTQIYGDANPKHQWIDDIEIWNRKPN